MKLRMIKFCLCLVFALTIAFALRRGASDYMVSARVSPSGPTNSSPIAVSPNDRQVWVVNPDDNSVTVINVQNDANQKVAEIPVGIEPQNLAIHPNGHVVYVSNTVSGTVSVIDATSRYVVDTIRVGTEPYGLALTPNGRKLYVANERSNDVSVINTATNRVIKTITGVGDEPRGVAVTSDGDGDDNDEKVYVTQFLAVDVPGKIVGADDYKEGRVTVISTACDGVIDTVALGPLADVGFKSQGSALACRINGATDPSCVTNAPAGSLSTGAFPNALNSVVIKGGRAYLPNNASSPNGPVRFNVNVQGFLSVIDTTTDTEGQANGQVQTINMNRGVNFEPAGPNKLFFAMPWQIAFKHNSDEGYVVSSGSNFVAKVTLDENGAPTVNAPKQAGDPGNLVRIFVGQNPRGIAINSTDTRGFVMNQLSRDVSVIDLDNNQVIATVGAAALPQPGTLEATVQYGKAIFFSSAAVNLPTLGPVIPPNKLSSEGWSGCVSCHANGLTDGVVWMFATGPRKSLALNGTFNPHDPTDQKILNYSGVRDEVQDFEANIRDVQGGGGLIDGAVNAVLTGPPNAGRSAPLDALKEFVARGVRTPISPLRNVPRFSRDAVEVKLGRLIFRLAGCADCHGGPGWSSARVDFTPPPAADEVVRAQVIRLLRQVGTFDPANVNEIRDNGAAPLGADGFAPPSLLGAWATGPLFHNGSAVTIDDILDNVTHRRAGLDHPSKSDLLNHPRNRALLVKFLKSIDASTRPFTSSP
jgi:YVTN family beta-propeller protein